MTVADDISSTALRPSDPICHVSFKVLQLAPDACSSPDGLGAMGSGSHTPAEHVNLATLPMQTERAAILMYRLLH